MGAAVAVVLTVGLGLAGCGGSDEPAPEDTGLSIEELNEELFSSPEEDPLLDEPAEEEPVDEYPDTPESETFDQVATVKGWEIDGYTQASEWVLMMCESMDAWEPGVAEALAMNHVSDMTEAEKAALEEGAAALCPAHAKDVKAALKGDVKRSMNSGSYEIVSDPGLDPEKAGPGTYQVSGELENCYWERTTQAGDIIDNQFATQARKITVTVRVGELFTSDGCGTWAPVS